MKKIFLFSIFTFFLSFILQAQVEMPQKVKDALDEKGITENEVKAKLLEKGIDIEKSKPEDALKYQKEIQAAVKEIEEEKKKTGEKIDRIAEKDADKNVEADTIGKSKSKMLDKKNPLVLVDTAKINKIKADSIKLADEDLARKDGKLPLMIWGQQIFRNKELKNYQNGEDVKPAANYVLGAGDKININIWGNARYSVSQEISADGYLQLDKLPRIFLKGVPYGKAKEILYSRLSQYYPFSKDQFSVTIAYQRSVTVNIVGEVMASGSYTISAQNTAFNALISAGGPSDIGSVRNIQLIRAGQKAKRLDVYEFLKNPAAESEFFLQNNDYIHVPVAEKVVSIFGAIKRPFRYELLKEENLVKLIEFAGGMNDNAYQTTIQITRFVNDEEKIIDVNLRDLTANKKDFELLSGDKIKIREIPKTFQNFAEITGAVDFPSRYEITQGMTVSDLVQKAILKKEARTDAAYLVRTNSDKTLKYERINLDSLVSNPKSNIKLRSEDKLIVYSLVRFTDKDSVTISGAVRVPGSHPLDTSKIMRVSDLLVLGGGLLPTATDFGYLKGESKTNKFLHEYTRIDFRKVLADLNSPDNKIVSASQELKVFFKDEFIDSTFITVSGSVKKSGMFPYSKSLKLQDAITLAGGFRLEAASNRVDIFRIVLNENRPTKTVVATVQVDRNLSIPTDKNIDLEPFDQVVVRSVADFALQKMVSIEGEVMFPGPYALLNKNEKITSLLKRAGGLTEEAFPEGATLYRTQDSIGYVVLKLEDAIKNPENRHNFILRDGDLVSIPKLKDFVVIRGATRASELYATKILDTNKGRITVAFNEGKDAKWYIQEYAAGIAKNGSSNLITVEDPSGQILKTKNYVLFRSYPKVRKGSIITVGVDEEKKKAEKTKVKKDDTDWAKVISTAIAQATAVLSLILLLQNVNK